MLIRYFPWGIFLGRVLEVEQKELLERMRAQHEAVKERAAEVQAKPQKA